MIRSRLSSPATCLARPRSRLIDATMIQDLKEDRADPLFSGFWNCPRVVVKNSVKPIQAAFNFAAIFFECAHARRKGVRMSSRNGERCFKSHLPILHEVTLRSVNSFQSNHPSKMGLRAPDLWLPGGKITLRPERSRVRS